MNNEDSVFMEKLDEMRKTSGGVASADGELVRLNELRAMFAAFLPDAVPDENGKGGGTSKGNCASANAASAMLDEL